MSSNDIHTVLLGVGQPPHYNHLPPRKGSQSGQKDSKWNLDCLTGCTVPAFSQLGKIQGCCQYELCLHPVGISLYAVTATLTKDFHHLTALFSVNKFWWSYSKIERRLWIFNLNLAFIYSPPCPWKVKLKFLYSANKSGEKKQTNKKHKMVDKIQSV